MENNMSQLVGFINEQLKQRREVKKALITSGGITVEHLEKKQISNFQAYRNASSQGSDKGGPRKLI